MIDEIRLSFNNGILYSLFIAVFFELFSPSFHSASTDWIADQSSFIPFTSGAGMEVPHSRVVLFMANHKLWRAHLLQWTLDLRTVPLPLPQQCEDIETLQFDHLLYFLTCCFQYFTLALSFNLPKLNLGYFYYQQLVLHMFAGILIPASWLSAFATYFLLVNSFFSELFHALSGNFFFSIFICLKMS